MKMNSKFFNRLVVYLFFVFGAVFITNNVALATNIISPNQWAWNDALKWIDFNNANGSVNVTNSKIEGYAIWGVTTSYINFDCATAHDGDCTTSYHVFNDSGVLSGWAWSDAIGWISFTCDHTADGTQAPYNVNTCNSGSNPSGVTYGVTIKTNDPNKGDFSGWAWNDAVGWISFNCDHSTDGTPGNPNTCFNGVTGVTYKVNTSWSGGTIAATGSITSVTFNTGKSVNYNSIMWRGLLGNNATVKFQLATSDIATGPWVDTDFKGPTGDSTSYYAAPFNDVPVSIVSANHKNKQYYRYKLIIDRFENGTSPTVRDVIVNWSP